VQQSELGLIYHVLPERERQSVVHRGRWSQTNGMGSMAPKLIDLPLPALINPFSFSVVKSCSLAIHG